MINEALSVTIGGLSMSALTSALPDDEATSLVSAGSTVSTLMLDAVTIDIHAANANELNKRIVYSKYVESKSKDELIDLREKLTKELEKRGVTLSDESLTNDNQKKLK